MERRDGDEEAVHRTFDRDREDPMYAVTETVAELKGVESDRLEPLYGCLDHVVDHIFSDPPDEEADLRVTFSYEGFRVTIDQDGHATFRPL